MCAALTPLIVQSVVDSFGYQRGFQVAFWIFGCGVGIPACILFTLLRTPHQLEKLKARIARYEEQAAADALMAPSALPMP